MKTKISDIEKLFIYLERFFSIAGIWPFKRTYIHFSIYITHYIVYLVMAYTDFYDVFGNLELMVMNLVETIALTMCFTTVCLMRFSNLLKPVINTVKKNIMEREFENSEEKRIYYHYIYMSKIFTYGSNVTMFITVMLLYFRPILLLLMSDQALHNDTESFMLPYRIHTFFQINNNYVYILTYLCLFPLTYASICHMAVISLLVILVFHICGELSIVSYRIKNIKTDSQNMVVERIRDFVITHLKIIGMAKSIDDAYNLVLLDKLFGNSMILSISIYYVMTNLEVSKMATCFTFMFFAMIAVIMLFGLCFIGDQLTQQCINIQNAYYQSDWYEMPLNCRKYLLICMIHGQDMLQITAGRVYIFNLNGFTDIVKTSMAYFSMLRTML